MNLSKPNRIQIRLADEPNGDVIEDDANSSEEPITDDGDNGASDKGDNKPKPKRNHKGPSSLARTHGSRNCSSCARRRRTQMSLLQ